MPRRARVYVRLLHNTVGVVVYVVLHVRGDQEVRVLRHLLRVDAVLRHRRAEYGNTRAENHYCAPQ